MMRESPVLNDKGITVVFKAIIGLRQDFVSLVIPEEYILDRSKCWPRSRWHFFSGMAYSDTAR
jgi:hypothetical protein